MRRVELLDEHHWQTRQQLALAIFEWTARAWRPGSPSDGDGLDEGPGGMNDDEPVARYHVR